MPRESSRSRSRTPGRWRGGAFAAFGPPPPSRMRSNGAGQSFSRQQQKQQWSSCAPEEEDIRAAGIGARAVAAGGGAASSGTLEPGYHHRIGDSTPAAGYTDNAASSALRGSHGNNCSSNSSGRQQQYGVHVGPRSSGGRGRGFERKQQVKRSGFAGVGARRRSSSLHHPQKNNRGSNSITTNSSCSSTAGGSSSSSNRDDVMSGRGAVAFGHTFPSGGGGGPLDGSGHHDPAAVPSQQQNWPKNRRSSTSFESQRMMDGETGQHHVYHQGFGNSNTSSSSRFGVQQGLWLDATGDDRQQQQQQQQSRSVGGEEGGRHHHHGLHYKLAGYRGQPAMERQLSVVSSSSTNSSGSKSGAEVLPAAGNERHAPTTIGGKEEENTLDGPLLNFKQFVITKPDDCTQKQLSADYEAYVKRYRQHHANLFFKRHGSDAFMRERYHPNLLRRQHGIQAARAKTLAHAFMQKFHTGVWSMLSLEADSRELRRFYGNIEEDSPLFVSEWPSRETVSVRRLPRGASCSAESSAAAVVLEIESDDEKKVEVRSSGGDEEGGTDDSDHQLKRHMDSEEDAYGDRDAALFGGAEAGLRQLDDVALAARKCSGNAEMLSAAEDEEVGGGKAGQQRSAGKSKRREIWPPYLNLPFADALFILNVDSSVSKFDILDELADKGVVDVGMEEGESPVHPRTAFIFFEDETAKLDFKRNYPDLVLKLTKPVLIVSQEGDEQETLKVINLTLSEPVLPSQCEVSVTPPVACSVARIHKDLETSAALILALDRQMGVWDEEEETQHPLLSCFPDSWDVKRQLDTQLTYLRQVHSLCYYSGQLCKDVVDLHARCGAAYLRPKLPAAFQAYLESSSLNDLTAFAPSGETSEDEEEAELEQKSHLHQHGLRGGRGRGRRLSSSNDDEGGVAERAQQHQEEDEDEQMNGLRGRVPPSGGKGSETGMAGADAAVARSQRRWLRRLDARLQTLLEKVENLQERLPAAIDVDTPVISLKWNAFCQEKVFEDDEHKHRCRLCNKPFKAPHFVFKHLRKKHEEELNYIIESYAAIVMKEAYLRDPNKPLVLQTAQSLKEGRSNSNNVGESETGAPYGFKGGVPPPGSFEWMQSAASNVASPAMPVAALNSNSAVAAAGGLLAPPGCPVGPLARPFGVFMIPSDHIHRSGAPPLYTMGPHSGPPPVGFVPQSHMHPPAQSFPFGFMPPHPISGTHARFDGVFKGSAMRRPDWDAPEPTTARLGSAGGELNGSRRLASYADL